MYSSSATYSNKQSHAKKDKMVKYSSPKYVSPNSNGPIVQEISLSYSAPYMTDCSSSDEPSLKIQIPMDNRAVVESSDYENGSLQEYISDYETRTVKRKPIESVEKIDYKGRHETEFPVQIFLNDKDSIHSSSVYSVPIIRTPIRIYDTPTYSVPVQEIISERTTIEELTTITTTNIRQTPQMSPTSVSVLKQQFEKTSSGGHDSRNSQRSPARTNTVLIHKPGPEFVYSADQARVRQIQRSNYSPSNKSENVISTTIVDIDPVRYNRRNSPKYVQERFEESVHEMYSISRSSSGEHQQQQESSRSKPVRAVVEQFQHKIESRPSPPQRRITEQTVEEVRIQKTTPVPVVHKITETPRQSSGTVKEWRSMAEQLQVVTKEVPQEPVRVQDSNNSQTRVDSTETITSVVPQPSPNVDNINTNRSAQLEESFMFEQETKTSNWQPSEPLTISEPPRPPTPSPQVLTPRQLSPVPIEPVDEPAPVPEVKKEKVEIQQKDTSHLTVHEEITSHTHRKQEEPERPPRRSRTVTDGSSSVNTFNNRTFQSSNTMRMPFNGSTHVSTTTITSGLSSYGQGFAEDIRNTREREKREMADLNDRFAIYIEKVRFLEAQNRKLAHDLDGLRSRFSGTSTGSVSFMCESEIKTARVVIEDANRQRDALELEISRLIAELDEYKKKYEVAVVERNSSRNDSDDLLQKIAQIEAEIGLFKRRIVIVEEEIARIRRENQRLLGEISRSKSLTEQESLKRRDFENQVKVLLEECQYVSHQQTSEVSQLVVDVHRDTTAENREYFKRELAAAIREIRAEYDSISIATRHDMESWYKVKVQEIQSHSQSASIDHTYAREEVKKLRVTLTEMRSKLSEMEGRNMLLEKQIQELNYTLEEDNRTYEAALAERDVSINKMREECQALMLELQMLLDKKTTLDAEIAIYRRMLEGEENRAGLRQLVEQVVRTNVYSTDHALETRRVVTSTESHSSNLQRSAIGSSSIQSASASSGHYRSSFQ